MNVVHHLYLIAIEFEKRISDVTISKLSIKICYKIMEVIKLYFIYLFFNILTDLQRCHIITII